MAPQREWFEKDYYKVLGVAENATAKEISSAYRKLAKQFHPDANPGSEDRFKEVSAAYDVLGDEARRKEYDEVRRYGAAGNPFAGAGGAGAPGAGGFSNFGASDLGDLLGNIFGRARGGSRGPGGAGPGRPAGATRGADLETRLHLSFEDAIRGLTTTVNVTSEVACHTCHGSGAAPGTAPEICPICGGRGVINDNQGLFSFSQPCQACSGTGFRVEHPCPTCAGSGVEYSARQVKVRIPPGVEDGQRIRIKGRGGAGRNGGPAGNLYVIVAVDHHPVFGRKGRDLTVTAPVTFAEAALGTTIKVPTLDAPVTLKVPPGTPSGRTLRVRGRGVPSNSGKGSPGDLLVTVDVSVPSTVTPEQEQVLEQLREVTDGASLRSAKWGAV